MKPIEPGCLCYSYDPAISGTCEADKSYGAGDVIRGDLRGEKTEILLRERVWRVVFPNGEAWFIAARHLTRIDGGEDENVTTEQDQEVPA